MIGVAIVVVTIGSCGGNEGDLAAFCAAYADVNRTIFAALGGDEELDKDTLQKAADRVADNAPPDIRESAETFADGVIEMIEANKAGSTSPTAVAGDEVNEYSEDHCGDG